MRILVCGGRGYSNRVILNNVLNNLCIDYECITASDEYGNWLTKGVTIIHGGAKGADALADQWAVTNWVPIEEYKADWSTHGKKAGILRNIKMLEEGKPDIVIAFPGGRGTAHMVSIAKKSNIPVMQIPLDTINQL